MDEKDCFVLTLYWVCTDFVLDRVLGCVLTLYWVSDGGAAPALPPDLGLC